MSDLKFVCGFLHGVFLRLHVYSFTHILRKYFWEKNIVDVRRVGQNASTLKFLWRPARPKPLHPKKLALVLMGRGVCAAFAYVWAVW